MTLSDRIAAAQGPERALDAEIAKGAGCKMDALFVLVAVGLATDGGSDGPE